MLAIGNSSLAWAWCCNKGEVPASMKLGVGDKTLKRVKLWETAEDFSWVYDDAIRGAPERERPAAEGLGLVWTDALKDEEGSASA